MILKLMKILKILRKILKNYIRSKNRHFKGFFKKKMIYVTFDNNIIYIYKKYKFYKWIFIIKLYYILFYNNIRITCLI